MSFSVVLKDADFFKKIMNAVEILEEPIIRIEEDRLLIRQMETSHSALVHFEIPKSTFSQYQFDKPDVIKISRDELMKCLRKTSTDQMIGLAIEEGQEDTLTVTLSGKAIKDFTVPIFTVPSDERPLIRPIQKEFNDVKIKIDSSALADTVNEFSSILSKATGRLDFTAMEGNLVVKAKGSRRGLTVTHMLGMDILAMEVPDKAVESAYWIDLMSQIVEKSAQLSGIVLMEFAEKCPVKLTYELPFEGSLYYYIAPMLKVVGERNE